jgi:hypothetical protein
VQIMVDADWELARNEHVLQTHRAAA